MTTINKCTAKAWATTTRTNQNKNKPNMYTSFSKRERQYDPCRAKEILTIQEPAGTAKAWATTTRTNQNKNKPNMYTSFSKRERQYDPCRAKEINNPGTRRYCKSVGENKQEQAKTRTSLICIPRSLSVSNNMTRVGRKKLTIQELL